MKKWPLFVLLALIGCTPSMRIPAGEREPEVVMTAATEAFLADVHRRAFGHGSQPDRERVLCVLGRVEPGRIYIDGFMAPRVITATETTASYWPCRHPQYIGSYHTHPVTALGDGCWHSTPDIEALRRLRQEVISLVSCERDGKVVLLSRVKRGYSLRSRSAP